MRTGWLTLLLLSVLAVAACTGRPGDTSPDARIQYYGERLGGPSTYPTYARLGLAYADKAAITGGAAYFLEAAFYLDQSLAMQRNYEALLGLAGVSLALHRFPEARQYAREAVAASPDDVAAQGALFDAELGLGNDFEAGRLLGDMPEGSFERLVRSAALLEYHGDRTAALRDIEQACISEDPGARPASATRRAWCEVRIGALRLTQCDAPSARAHYDRATSILPGYVLAEEHLAELSAADGNPNEALVRYQRLLKTSREPRHRLQLAALCDSIGRSAEAAEQRALARTELLRRAAEDVRDAWHELALLDAEGHTTAAAAVGWARRDWRNRQDAHAADALAWALFRHGDSTEAAAASDRALASGGASPMILLHAAIIRGAAGHDREARTLAARAVACPPALTPVEQRLAEQAARRVTPRRGNPRAR